LLTCRLLTETLLDVDQFKEQLNIDIPAQRPTQIYVPKQALCSGLIIPDTILGGTVATGVVSQIDTA